MVVFDTTALALALDPTALPPVDPTTGKAVENCQRRMEHLIDTLSKAKNPILIPTPALAEYLVGIAGQNKQEFVDKLFASRNFEHGVFDVRAAIELSELLDSDSGKKLDPMTTKAKVKFDRQIVAIAKVHRAFPIYTGDTTLAAVARNNGVAAVMIWEIPKPPPETADMFPAQQ